jgi:ribosomal protein L37AE/L43A
MLCFPSCSSSSEFKIERYGSKVWVCLRCTTKAVEDLKHGVGMVVTCQWELSELGGDILGWPLPSSA